MRMFRAGGWIGGGPFISRYGAGETERASDCRCVVLLGLFGIYLMRLGGVLGVD